MSEKSGEKNNLEFKSSFTSCAYFLFAGPASCHLPHLLLQEAHLLLQMAHLGHLLLQEFHFAYLHTATGGPSRPSTAAGGPSRPSIAAKGPPRPSTAAGGPSTAEGPSTTAGGGSSHPSTMVFQKKKINPCLPNNQFQVTTSLKKPPC